MLNVGDSGLYNAVMGKDISFLYGTCIDMEEMRKCEREQYHRHTVLKATSARYVRGNHENQQQKRGTVGDTVNIRQLRGNAWKTWLESTNLISLEMYFHVSMQFPKYQSPDYKKVD